MEETRRKPRMVLAAATGAVVFALAMGTLAFLPEPAVETIDRDLDFTGESARWLVTRDAMQSKLFPGDPSFRSEWTHDDGWIVSVFAYTLAPDDRLDSLRGDFREGERSDGGLVLIDDENIPAPFEGFRLIEQRIDGEGLPYTMVHYFVHDPLGRDIHQLVSIVDLNDVEYADAELRELISSAVWVPVGEPSV